MKLIEEYKDSIFKQYLPVFAIFVFLGCMIIYEMVNIGSPTKYEIKKSFNGIVTSKFINKSWVYVELQNKTNKQEIKNAFNYAYDKPGLIQFIQVGDEVTKNECSDTIYIKRGEDKFHFIELAYWYNDETRSKEFKQEYMAKRLIRIHQAGCNVDQLALEVALKLIRNKSE